MKWPTVVNLIHVMLYQISETILELGFYNTFIDHIILTSPKGDYSCLH